MGPTQPTYPHLPQFCRITSGSVGSNVYPAFTCQWAPPLAMRDREACYVWEPNGIALQPGFYDCRLVGNYLGLPLYATSCCPVGSSLASAGG